MEATATKADGAATMSITSTILCAKCQQPMTLVRERNDAAGSSVWVLTCDPCHVSKPAPYGPGGDA